MSQVELIETTADHYVFTAPDGATIHVGRDGLTEPQARTIAENSLVPSAAIAMRYPTGLGFDLDASQTAQTQFGLDATGWQLQLDAGLAVSTQQVAFRDADGGVQLLTLADYLGLLAAYHLWCRAQWENQ